MAYRHGFSVAFIAASLFLAAGLSIVCMGTDGSDATEGDYHDFHWVMDDEKNVSITGHGDLDYFLPAWDDCVTMTLTVDDGTVNICDSVFSVCNTSTDVTINGPVGYIGENAFGDCHSLERFTVNGSVGTIGVQAFMSCVSMTAVTINGPVDHISSNAFADCNSLSELTIAGPMTSIQNNAFSNCTNLKTVNIACNDPLGITKGWDSNGYIAFWADTVNHVHRYSASYDWADDNQSCTVHIACANTSDHDHDEHPEVSTAEVKPTAIVPGMITYSVSGTYDGFAYADAKEVQIPPVTEGTKGDFRWIMNGTDLTVTGHGTLASDPMWVGLMSLTLNTDGATDIEGGAFSNCDSLVSLTVNGDLGSIGTNTFSYCDSLTAVTVNGPVGTVGQLAFFKCTSLTAVTLNGPVGTIDNVAFRSCASLTSITINGDVGSIGEQAFYLSNNLETFTVNGSVGTVGLGAFESCASLNEFTVRGSVGTIESAALAGCSSLSVFTVTGPITEIEDDSFNGCSDLRTLNIACNSPLDITAGSADYGNIARHADAVNRNHVYSATYEWAEDGSSCIVHIVCANTSDHNHDVTDAAIASKVKVQPTKTEMGTTEYTVSGTYDGFEYSDTKEIKDIPAEGKGNTAIYIAVAAVAVLAVAGGAFLFIRSRR